MPERGGRGNRGGTSDSYDIAGDSVRRFVSNVPVARARQPKPATFRVEYAHAAPRDNVADGRDTHARRTCCGGDAPGRTGWCGENDFIIVAVSQRGADTLRRTSDNRTRRCRQRQTYGFDDGTDARRRADMAEIGNQAVGNIRRRTRNARQAPAQAKPRLGQSVAPFKMAPRRVAHPWKPPLDRRQAERRVAK